MPTTWALVIDYINFAGDTVSMYTPVFRTEGECLWWKSYLWGLLTDLNGARQIISATCSRVP
jgi:hypothetical protein